MSEETKAPKIRIDSDGTSTGTKVYIDGVQVKFLESVKFEGKLNKTLVKLNLTHVYPEEGGIVNGD